MDEKNRALCYAYRNPPPGVKKTPYKILRKLVKKTDGRCPTQGAMAQAAKDFMDDKGQRGRKEGYRKTTKKEDKKILTTFKKNRPAGCGIDSREISDKLPKKIRAKVCRRTIRRRLAEKGYTPQDKLTKHDASKALCKRRVNWAKPYADWTKENWKSEIQAVGDFKTFTWYPKVLYPRFKRLRASWTYMNNRERHQTAFLRPKKWFPKNEWKLTKQQKVFGMTTSNGKMLAFLIPSPFDAIKWKTLVKKKIVPFLKRSFPEKRTYKILLDSEPVMHAPEPKDAYKEAGITILPGWPKYSAELNPQENVWPSAEVSLRKMEGDGGETFEQFQKYAVKAVQEYKGAKNLVGGMVNKVNECLDTQGAYISS